MKPFSRLETVGFARVVITLTCAEVFNMCCIGFYMSYILLCKLLPGDAKHGQSYDASMCRHWSQTET